MPNAQLMAALHASTKALREMARDDATYDFVYAHKNMFVSNRETFKAAVAACQERSGRELLDRLDLYEIYIEKVTEAELLHSCYYFVDSPLYKRFIQLVSKHGGIGRQSSSSTSEALSSLMRTVWTPMYGSSTYSAAPVSCLASCGRL